MRKTTHAAPARSLLIALIAALVLSTAPALAQAREAKADEQASRARAQLITRGAGYGAPQGSERVRTLQRQLRRAEVSPGPVDGRFGALTEAAVRQFQARAGLGVDGIVGPLTAAALVREAALISPGAGYRDPRGSERVRALQLRLRRAGARPGPVDGRFGPLTEAAVRQFQARAGLGVDGIVARPTRVALMRLARPQSEERRTNVQRAERQPPHRDRKPNPSNRAQADRGPQPSASAADPGDQSADSGPVLVVLAAGTVLLAGALALAFGAPARRRRPGAPVADDPPSAPAGPPPAAPAARGAQADLPLPQMGTGNGSRRPVERSAALGNGQGTIPMLGYAVISAPEGGVDRTELGRQAELIDGECGRRGLRLLELVRDREPRNGKGLERPGLAYAFGRISAGEARGLVVSELSRLSHSAAELGEILEWFARSEARLVAVAEGLDTAEGGGRLACRALIEVSGWERERLSQRTQKGLEAARLEGRRGRRAVADDPELREQITAMRAAGMTLQSIADRLNEQGVPTVRGGAKWRPSSVQATAGYKRQRPRLDLPSGRERAGGKER